MLLGIRARGHADFVVRGGELIDLPADLKPMGPRNFTVEASVKGGIDFAGCPSFQAKIDDLPLKC
jgi:hypothetical protein